MADVINLSKARKARGREQAKAKAAENRVRFGQDKAARDKARKEAERVRQELDSKKLDQRGEPT